MTDHAVPIRGGPKSARRPLWLAPAAWSAIGILLGVLFQESVRVLYDNFVRSGSYYSHGFLVPLVSIYFAWRDRKTLRDIPVKPTYWGYVVLITACVMVLFGDAFGFRLFGEIAIILMVIGLILIFLGARHVRRLWFPLAFLLFMIPAPDSLVAGTALRIKLLAAEGAVRLAHLAYLPMVRDGSYIHFQGDRLLVGEVCGGLRSLIALLALGALVSYISQTRPWSRVLILLTAGPIAVAANIFRIFLLCVIAYFWGSGSATGWVHDGSGVLIYVMAFGLLFGLDGVLRGIAPARVPSHSDAPKISERT